MSPGLKALQDIRDWAAKGEARDIGGRLGMDLPDDADFVALSEETPGVEPERPVDEAQAGAELDLGDISPEDLEALLALAAQSEG